MAVGRTTRITPAHAEFRLLSMCHAQHRALCRQPKYVQMMLSVHCTGGRYDGLMRSLWPPSLGQPMGAVGATLNVERLIALAAPQTLRSSSLQASQAGPGSPPLAPPLSPRQQRKPGLHHNLLEDAGTEAGCQPGVLGAPLWQQHQAACMFYGCIGMEGVPWRVQAEVLVCARGGGGLLKERKALAAMLWVAGIKTELVHAAAPSQTFQYEWAAARSIHWLVTINAVTFSTTDTVQVDPHCPRMPTQALFEGSSQDCTGGWARGLTRHKLMHAATASVLVVCWP